MLSGRVAPTARATPLPRRGRPAPPPCAALRFGRAVPPPAPPAPAAPLQLTPNQTLILVVAQFVALVGATVTGTLARRRRLEVEAVAAKLRAINAELRARAADAAEPGGCQADEEGESMRAYRMGLEHSLESPSSPHPVDAVAEADLALASTKRKVSRALGEGKQSLKAGCVGDALAAANDGLALARSLGDPRAERAMVRLAARALAASGDGRGALRELLRAADISTALGEADGDADLLGAIGDAYAELGDLDRAGAYYDRCIAAITDGTPPSMSSVWDC